MAFENLNVRVSADTAGANASLGRLEENIDDVGDEARQTAASFSALSASSTALSGSLTSLSTVTIATAVPAFLALSTALLPVTAALGGLAAILGAIGLVGFVSVLGAAKTNTQALKAQVQDLRSTVAQEFAPLFDRVTVVLTTLIDRLQATISELTPTQEQIDVLANSLLEVGTAIINLLPELSNLAFSLTSEFLPALVRIAEDVLPEIPGAIRFLVNTFRELRPELSRTVGVLGQLLPALFELGFTVLDVIGPKLAAIGTGLTRVVEGFNNLSSGAERLGVSFTLALPLASALATVIGGPLGVAVGGAALAFGLFREEITGVAQSIIAQAQPALTTLQTRLESVREFFSPLVEDLERLGEGLVTTGEAVAESLAPTLSNLGDAAENAEGPLTSFATASRDALRGFVQFLNRFVLPAFRFVFQRVVAPVLAEVSRAFATQLGPTIDEVAQTVRHLSRVARDLGRVLTDVWQAISPVVVPIIRTIGNVIGTLLVANIESTMQVLRGLMNLIQGDFDAALNNFGNAINTITDAIGELATEIGTGLLEALTPFGEVLTDWIDDGVTWLENLSADVFERLRGGLRTFADWMGRQLGNALDLAGVVRDGVLGVGDYLAGRGEDAAGALSDIASGVEQFGTNIGNALIDAINNAIPDRLGIDIPAIKVEGQTVVPAQTVGTDIDDNPISGAATGGFISQGGLLNVHEGERVVPAAQVQDRGTVNVEGGPSEVVVHVEGDTGVIKDVSAEVVRERERRANRNTGGSTRL